MAKQGSAEKTFGFEFDFIASVFNLVNWLTADTLKLTILQKSLLDLFILNYLAYNDKKTMAAFRYSGIVFYELPVYRLSKLWGKPYTTLRDAMKSLCRTKVTYDDRAFNLLVAKRVCKQNYYMMPPEVVYLLVRDCPKSYNTQCDRWHRSDLATYNLAKSFAQSDMAHNSITPLADISGIANKKQQGFSDWAEGVIKNICVMANKNNVVLVCNGKPQPVFPHLQSNGEFNKRRLGIDKACKLLDDMVLGRFGRQGAASLFNNLPESLLEQKDTKGALAELKRLKGDRKGIEAFALRCAENYFASLQPGMETYDSAKRNFPANIKDFFLKEGNGFVANFLLYYHNPVTVQDKAYVKMVNKMNDRFKKMQGEILDRLTEYADRVSDKKIKAFNHKLLDLLSHIDEICESGATSYSVAGCFDLIFDEIDKIKDTDKIIHTRHFDVQGFAVRQSMIHILDK